MVYAWCLMSNHIHLIVQAKENHRLSDIIRDFKKFTSKAILKKIATEPESRRVWMLNQFEYEGRNLNRITKYKFWKDDNHAIELESHMMEASLDYIHNNPVEAMIVSEPEHFLFSSANQSLNCMHFNQTHCLFKRFLINLRCTKLRQWKISMISIN